MWGRIFWRLQRGDQIFSRRRRGGKQILRALRGNAGLCEMYKNTTSLPAAGLIYGQWVKVTVECILWIRALHTVENECPAIC